MKKKKLRLRKWVKETLLIIAVGIVFALIMIFVISQYEKEAKKCDEYYGRICSIYEVDQYGKGVRR